MFEKGHKLYRRKNKMDVSKHKVRSYRNGTTRLMEPPNSYQKNFLSKMDFRTEVYHNMDLEYRRVVSDLGGAESLSTLELGLVERHVFCSFLIRNLETEMANAANGSNGEFLDKWIKLNHSIQSIVGKLGISRRKTKESKLKKHLTEQYEN